MPGAGRIWGTTDGGPLKGGAPRAVWQTLGADPRTVSAGLAAQRLSQLGRACHLIWNPLQGEIVQLIPVLRAGRLLGWPEDLNQMVPPEPDGDPDDIAEVNSEGRVCLQVGVVAFAWEPFTAWPMPGLPQILSWLDSWGIPREWPAGSPAPFPHGLTTCGNRRLWARGGHFGASQVPDLTAAGPGDVDIELLAGRAERRRQAEVSVPVRPEPVRPEPVRPEPVRPEPVTLAAERGGKAQPAAAGVRHLDDYFDGDEEAAGTLSRVG
jgi:hypothetical protein